MDGTAGGSFLKFGEWLAPYETPALSPVRIMWTGPLTGAGGLETYDGGEAAAVSATTGPFWEEDTSMRARMPVGVGTLPVSGTAVAVGGTGGEDKHTLTTAELPSHTHAGGTGSLGDNNDDNSSPPAASNGSVVSSYTLPTTAATGGGQSHQNMPPYQGVYFAKRTARIYRKPS